MNTDKYEKKALVIFMVAGVFLLALLSYALLLNEDSRNSLIKEGGFVESASALGYLLCAIFAAYKGKIVFLKQYHYFFTLLIFFTLRELDFHDKYTTMGIFKTRFYISDKVPFSEKLIGTIVVGVLLYIVFIILHRHFKQFWLGLKRHSPPAISVLIAVILIFVSRLVDGIGRKLIGFGIELSDVAMSYAEAIEEIIELGIPIFIFISFLTYFMQINAQQDIASDENHLRSIVSRKLGD
jgi:hypothetical protein